MHTYTTRRNLFANLANNAATATLTMADTLMNTADKRIVSAKNWTFRWKQYTKLTVAAQQAYKVGAYVDDVESVYVTVGSYRYTPQEVTNREEWDRINVTSVSSNIPTHWFFYDGQVELFPIPSASSNTITYNARKRGNDLTRADYTTGTITTVATSGVVTTVTGSGTTWSAAMVGRYIQIAGTDAANTGDTYWYEIATVPTSTTLTLVRTYGGTAITAGSATYTIGQCSLIPEPHDMLPIYEALKIYFTSVKPDANQAALYAGLFKEGYGQMVMDEGSKVSVVLDDGRDERLNPNLYVTL